MKSYIWNHFEYQYLIILSRTRFAGEDLSNIAKSP